MVPQLLFYHGYEDLVMPKPNFSLSLENLVFRDCEEFSFSNDIEDEKQPIWGDLKNLHSIDLWYVSNSVSLPRGLKSVPALDAVWIWNYLV
ncbi:hypothetical protein WN944_014662 [Citrus x changshan-huyou]|uniref:Uncharacterized protein n=1 Tax=Citrus x changshan-huyou TaxID=2935761 RepID=A0AAP0M632_9ROSI